MFASLSLSMCIYIYIYICTHIYIFIYTHTHYTITHLDRFELEDNDPFLVLNATTGAWHQENPQPTEDFEYMYTVHM